MSFQEGRNASGGGVDERLLEKKHEIKHQLLNLSKPMYTELMINIKKYLRESVLCDPDMWPNIKNSIGTAVDQFLSDVEHEIGRSLCDAWLHQPTGEDEASHKEPPCILRPLYSFRAFVLYHYLPHDKMLFGRLKDPVYLMMYLLTILPIHGVRIIFFSMVLLMLCLPRPPDEYQLINFVLLCKGMQFLSSGLIQLAKGALIYFYCYSVHRDELHPERLMTCIDNYGPGAHDGYGLAMDYLGSIMLVWVAFGLMARSHQHAKRRSFESSDEATEKNEKAGGRFRALLHYDRKCFAASVFVLLLLVGPKIVACFCTHGLDAIHHLHSGDPQINASIFWCCVLYSLLSLPFFPFMIAGLQEVMTHCDATGFNPKGHCVAYVGTPVEIELNKAPPKLQRGGTRLMAAGAHVLKLVQSGAEYRNDSSRLNYKAGDIFRGAYNEYVVKKWPAKAAANEVLPEEAEAAEAGTGLRLDAEVAEVQDDGEDYGAPMMNFSISAATIPVNKMQEDYKGSAAFVVEVVAGLGLDGEAVPYSDGAEHMVSDDSMSPVIPNDHSKWIVVKRYRDFEQLAGKLGPRCKKYPDAPFPTRTMFSGPTGSQLEQRRSNLEAWLARVLTDEKCCYERWNKEMTEFLTLNKWQEEDIARLMRKSGETTLNLPKQLGEQTMSGPLERARPLASKPLASKPHHHVKKTVEVGRQARGGTADGHYQFGDYTRGLVSTVTAAASSSCRQPPARLATWKFEEEPEGTNPENDDANGGQGSTMPL